MGKVFVVNPVTFSPSKRVSPKEAWEMYLDLLSKVASEGKRGNPIDVLKRACNILVNRLREEHCVWRHLPSQPEFPWFFSSMADQALASSSIGVALALQCLHEGVNLAQGYGRDVARLLATRDGLIQVVRACCLLHGAGKPFYGQASQAVKKVASFLEGIGLGGEAASDLAKAATNWEEPSTNLERLIYCAVKAVSQDRCVLPGDPQALSQALKKLSEKIGDQLAVKVANFLSAPHQAEEELRKVLPLDEDDWKQRDEHLADGWGLLASKGGKPTVALLLMEAAGIQRIVRRSESLRGLVGFSALVEEGMRLAARKIEEKLAPESVIFVGGGTLMAVIPPFMFEEIRREAAEAYTGNLRGEGGVKAPGSGDWVTFTLYEFKNGPAFTWQASASPAGRVDLASLASRGFAQLYQLASIALQQVDTDGGGGEKRLKPSGLCAVCNSEESLPDGDKEKEKLLGRMGKEEREEELGDGRICGICCAAYMLRTSMFDSIRHLKVEVDQQGRCTVSPGRNQYGNELPGVVITARAVELLAEKLEDNLSSDDDMKALLAGKTISMNLVPTLDKMGKTMILLAENARKGERKEEGGVGVPSRIAVVAGDGDNFGAIKASMASLPQYRRVSELFAQVLIEGVASGLSEVLLRQIQMECKLLANDGRERDLRLDLPFLVVYAGGDDFLLLLDAAAIFLFLHGLNRYLEGEFGRRSSSYSLGVSVQYLGVSLGVAVVDNRSPLHAALDAAKALEREAKKKSKREQEHERREAGVLFGSGLTVAIHRFTGMPSSEEVKEIYGKELDFCSDRVFRTSWPRTSGELFGSDGLLETVRELLEAGVKSSDLKRLFRGWEKTLPLELQLRTFFKASRERQKAARAEVFLKLAKNIPILVGGPNPTGKYEFTDIMEVLDIISDELGLLPSKSKGEVTR